LNIVDAEKSALQSSTSSALGSCVASCAGLEEDSPGACYK